MKPHGLDGNVFLILFWRHIQGIKKQLEIIKALSLNYYKKFFTIKLWNIKTTPVLYGNS